MLEEICAVIDAPENGSPYEAAVFFTSRHLKWLSEAQVRRRFPDLQRHDPQLDGFLRTVDPAQKSLLICVGMEGACSSGSLFLNLVLLKNAGVHFQTSNFTKY